MFQLVRRSLPVILLSASGAALAVGLGELRGAPVLGERLQVEIDLLGIDKQIPDVSCFRVVPPSSATDLPWVKKARFVIRKDVTPPALVVISESALREPIVQLAVQLGCGNEVFREYAVFVSPASESAPPMIEPPRAVADLPTVRRAPERVPRKPAPVLPEASAEAPPKPAPKRPAKPPRPVSEGADRLMLSEGGEVGEPSLRLSMDIGSARQDTKEVQRDVLRLEFRMLMAMQEQATNQLATAEKLRNMEAALGQLQDKSAALQAPPTPASTPESKPAEPAPAPKPALPAPATPMAAEESASLSEWSLYGALIGAVGGLAGWFGWRSYRARKERMEDLEPFVPPIIVDDIKPSESLPAQDEVDLAIEPAAPDAATTVDLELEAAPEAPAAHVMPSPNPAVPRLDSVLPETTLDEHFEANPVMELADIMLSFGRVKGAAQALQEYIDNNPQEALKPWIRLMDVYRMAGMRNEFENVARNLNQHFNVEVQQWEEAASGTALEFSSDLDGAPGGARMQSLEEIPRLINTVVELWNTGDVVGYLYQLLRDNRGGQRAGFTMPVVDDILFLIELKETSNRME